jgi:hypothetical protein
VKLKAETVSRFPAALHVSFIVKLRAAAAAVAAAAAAV